MKKLMILTGLLLATAAWAQTEVVTGITRGKEYGVTYLLPKTQIEVEVQANKITYTPGEFSKYGEQYLRLTNLSGTPQEYWELVSAKVKSVGVPDSENIYFVKMKDNTVAPLMELTPDGIVKSINMPYTPQKAATPPASTTPKKKINPRDFLTEEILVATSTAKMAELVAKEIYNIRESRNALVRGQADNMPKDGEQLKLMIETMDEQERAMTEMFAGTKEVKEKMFTIRLTPQEVNNEVAFRFSKKMGMVASNDLIGEPVYMTLKNLKTVNIPADDGKKKVDGIAYNVPGKASVTLVQGKNQLFEGELPITQFGTVEYLAPVLFNKKSTTKVLFNPETGGLVKVDKEGGE